MTGRPAFDLTVSHDPYQYLRRRQVSLYLTVRASGLAVGSGPDRGTDPPTELHSRGPRLAQVMLLDHSGSMNYPPTKLQRAKDACCAALDTLRDGTRFAIVGGTHQAHMVYPRESFLAPANPETRAEAKHAVRGIVPGNQGTIIGNWLDKASRLLDEPDADLIRHVLLLTDGRNQHQDQAPRTLTAVLADCRPVFTCDALGIGDDWEPDELTQISQELQGTSDAVPDLDDLPEVFRGLVRTAMSRGVREVALRVRCVPGVCVSALEETMPNLTDLGAHPSPVPGTAAVDYGTGPWRNETRHYVATLDDAREDPHRTAASQLDRLASIELVTGAIGTDRAVSLVPPRPVDVRWLDLAPPATQLGTGQERHRKEKELRALRRDGGAAWLRESYDEALRTWTLALALARELRNEDALRRLDKVLVMDDSVDPSGVSPGRPRLRSGIGRKEVLALFMGQSTSTSTYRSAARPPGAPEPADARPAGPGATCPECGRVAVAGARFCENPDCGHEFTTPEPGPAR